MKKRLGILIFALLAAVGLTGTVTAQPVSACGDFNPCFNPCISPCINPCATVGIVAISSTTAASSAAIVKKSAKKKKHVYKHHKIYKHYKHRLYKHYKVKKPIKKQAIVGASKFAASKSVVAIGVFSGCCDDC